MATTIERPRYFEGQVLSAADLEAGQTYARGRLARHNRYLHTWGIASGLGLREEKRKTPDGNREFIDVFLEPGVAIDGFGREVIVAEETAIDPQEFVDANVFLAGAWHPLFLTHVEQDPSAPPFTASRCGLQENTRKLETYQYQFGRPGTEQEPNPSGAPDFDDGPDGGPWLLLLGYVQWDGEHFKALSSVQGGIGPTYAGASADSVVARSGHLSLQSLPDTAASSPMLVLDEADGGTLQFGTWKDKQFSPTLTLKANGDLETKGSVSSKTVAGQLQIESGVATDGALLPLPGNITDDDIANGSVTLHIQVTPHLPGSVPPAGIPFVTPVAIPYECRAEGRRVFCRVIWIGAGGGGPPTIVSAACDYTLIASAPEGGS